MARKQSSAIQMTPDQSLSEASVAITRLHSGINQHLQRTLKDAIRIGELLCKAKELCPHGRWEKWCKRELPFGATTKEWYMRFHLGQSQILTGKVLTIREARKLLSPPKPEAVESDEDAAASGNHGRDARATADDTNTPTHGPEAGSRRLPGASSEATQAAAPATDGGGEERRLPSVGAKLWICRDTRREHPDERPRVRLFPDRPRLNAEGECEGNQVHACRLPTGVFPQLKPGHAATCRLDIQFLTPPEDLTEEAEEDDEPYQF